MGRRPPRTAGGPKLIAAANHDLAAVVLTLRRLSVPQSRGGDAARKAFPTFSSGQCVIFVARPRTRPPSAIGSLKE